MSGGMIKTDTSGLADKVITNEGDIVIAAECRPLAKSVSFVVVGVKE